MTHRARDDDPGTIEVTAGVFEVYAPETTPPAWQQPPNDEALARSEETPSPPLPAPRGSLRAQRRLKGDHSVEPRRSPLTTLVGLILPLVAAMTCLLLGVTFDIDVLTFCAVVLAAFAVFSTYQAVRHQVTRSLRDRRPIRTRGRVTRRRRRR